MTEAAPSPGEARPHRLEEVAPLAARPLDGGGVEAVLALAVETGSPVRHGCSITAWRPVHAGGAGAGPGPASALLDAPPRRYRAIAPPEPHAVRFEFDGATARAQVPLPAGTSYYGTGEVAGPLLRNGRGVELWNTDAYRYGAETPALYQSHPFVLAVLADGRALGVLADTFRRGTCETPDDGIELCFEEEPFDVLLIEGADPLAVCRALAALVGAAPAPPPWALGYHQCRYSYMDAAEVRRVARELRERQVPCDAIWFDIDYMDRFRSFTWDRERFPDPAGLVAELAELGFRSVAILDPGIAAHDDNPVYREGLADDHFVRYRGEDGEPAGIVLGRVWPGVCAFPDFTRPRTRDWWAGKVAEFVRCGLGGLWVDMNEPALFRTPTRTLPDAAWHRGAGEDSPLAGPHRRVHNLYGQLMARATREGLLRARPAATPFVLSRSSHLAGAQYAATWTGDNQARWEDLRWSIPMVLSLSVSGQPFSGPDVGGFSGDGDAELFARWFELAAFLPFCRGHAEKGTCRKEPWAFGPETETAVRAALERRMRLLPTLAVLASRAEREGLPLVHPVAFADPTDRALRGIEDAFLLGEDLLVAPIVRAGERARTVTLPRPATGPGADGWYHWPDGGPLVVEPSLSVEAPLGRTPVFARAGAVVLEAATPAAHHGAQGDGIRLHAFLDARGRAAGPAPGDPATTVEVTLVGGALQLVGAALGAGGVREVRAHAPDGGVHTLRAESTEVTR